MSMYALQVMTGMEAEITQKLRGKGVDARCPQERRIGAVGNAGALFTCEKVFGYSQKNAEGWFKALKKKYPLYKGESGKIEDALAQRIAFAEELRRDGAKYGLIFSR